MKHELFGELTFSVGWKRKRIITLFNKEYQVNLKIQAYFEEDEISKQQEKSYKEFIDSEEEVLNKVTLMMLEYSSLAEESFVPRTLLLERDGALALICDDNNEPDEGIAICIFPEMKIMSLDEYL